MNQPKGQRRVKIAILIGRGSNCTCPDCPVLYGWKCPTTPINNKKDRLKGRKAK